jgi:hypothetical protein
MYRQPPTNEPVSQGDILSDCPVFGLDANDVQVSPESEPVRWLARVLVVTQVCDLANAKTTRAVTALVHSAQHLIDHRILTAAVIRDRIRTHQVFGWYFLPAISEIGFPESVVDLRNLHTIPRSVLEELARRDRRVCRVNTPYREHLAQQLAITYCRIGLPQPYETI